MGELIGRRLPLPSSPASTETPGRPRTGALRAQGKEAICRYAWLPGTERPRGMPDALTVAGFHVTIALHQLNENGNGR